MCERVDVCVCLSYLMSSVEEGWDASLCCRSLDPCNTRELSLNVRSTCPFMYTNKNVRTVHVYVTLMRGG